MMLCGISWKKQDMRSSGMHVLEIVPSLQMKTDFWKSASSALVTATRTSWYVMLWIAWISSSVNNLNDVSRKPEWDTFEKKQQIHLSRHDAQRRTYPFCLFSNQKRSPFLIRSNWSRIMAEKTGPGPSRNSSNPPGNSSSLDMSLLYSSAILRSSWRKDSFSVRVFILLIIIVSSSNKVSFLDMFSCQLLSSITQKRNSCLCACLWSVCCRFHLWICAVQSGIYLLKCSDWRQVQSSSDLSVTAKTKVSSSVDGHGHQVCSCEP